jgi:hypothetical protein
MFESTVKFFMLCDVEKREFHQKHKKKPFSIGKKLVKNLYCWPIVAKMKSV